MNIAAIEKTAPTLYRAALVGVWLLAIKTLLWVIAPYIFFYFM